MNLKYKILHLEDVQSDAELVARELQKSIDFDHLVIDSEKDYLIALEQFCPDVILCDHSLPSFNSLEALKIVKEKKLHIPFILITATMSEVVAASVVREGADDYILKDRLKRLPNAVLNAIEKYRYEKERKALIDEVHQKEVMAGKHLLELSNKLLVATKIAGIGIWEFDLQTGTFVADDIVFAFYGVAPSDFDGSYEQWLQFIHPDDKESVSREFQNALATTGKFEMVFRIVRPDRSVRFIKAVSLVEKNTEGNPIRLIGSNQDITAAKEAEKVILENEAKYRSIFENSLDAILLTVADGYILAANPAACAIFGMTEQEIIDKGRFGVVDVTDPRLPVLLEERRRTGKAKGVTTFIRGDGSTFPGEVSSVIFENAHGEARTSMVIRDISDRKKMEKALENERLRYYEVFQQAPSAIAILKGVDHRFAMVNPNYLQLIGKKEIIGKTVMEVVPEVESQGFIDLLNRVFQSGKCFTAKEMLAELDRTNTGRLEDCYLNFIFQPYRNDKGDVEGIFFFGNDVTEQVISRKKIEASEKQFRQIVETAQEGIWMLDEKNLTRFVNAKMCRILGYSEEEMMGRPPHFFVKQKGKKGQGMFSTGMNTTIDMYEDQFVTKSGAVVSTHLSTNPIVDDKGNYKGALAMVTDITVRKRLEEKIMRQKVQQQKEITKATLQVQEKERNFLGSELHDNINQILTAVKLQLKHCMENPDAPKEIITRSHTYLAMAIEEIRKLSQRLVTHRFDEDSLIEAIRFLIAGLSIEKIVILNADKLNESAIHESIKLTIFRIVQEQLNNICKYAKATRVTITVSNDAKEVALQICDNGIGFNTEGKRAGVGLTNIYNRVESYNGTVDIRSAPGEGCDLQLRIPLDQPLSPLHN